MIGWKLSLAQICKVSYDRCFFKEGSSDSVQKNMFSREFFGTIYGISRSTGSILCRYEQGVLPSPDVASVYTEPRTYLTHILQIPYLYLAHVSCLTHTLFTFHTAHIDLHIAHILHIPSTSTFQIVRKPSTHVAHINGLRTFKRLTHGSYISLAHIFDT